VKIATRVWPAFAAGIVAATAVAAATWRVDARGAGGASTVDVGIVYSRTGAYAGFGAEYRQGLALGLRYVRARTRNCGGHALRVTFVDDHGDPATAGKAAEQLIGKGYKIIAGSTASGSALQIAPLAEQDGVLFISGAAASDAITGLNRHTFRAGRQSYQDVRAARAFFTNAQIGKNIVFFGEDTAFGQSTFGAVQQLFGGGGRVLSKVLAPFETSASVLATYIEQVKTAHADLVYVAWAGSNAATMWEGMRKQGLTASTPVTTNLWDRVSYPAVGRLGRLKLFSHYVYQAPRNAVNAWLVKQMHKEHRAPDLFTPDGFVTAQMICRAVQKAGGNDVEKMISALEGWQFLAPKGVQRIRKSDHAMLQPMFQVRLVNRRNGRYEPKLLRALPARLVQPPVHPFPS